MADEVQKTKTTKEEKKKSKEFIDTHGEYSKKVLNKFIIVWFLIGFYGVFVTTYELLNNMEVHIEALYLYIGGPVTGGIITYLVKSMKEKINLALKCQDIYKQLENDYFEYGAGSDDSGMESEGGNFGNII